MRLEHHVGYTRRVFVVGRVAIKLPRIYWKAGLHTFWHILKGRNRIERLLQELDYSWQSWGSMKGIFFGGIISNWLEFEFYMTENSPLLTPTYFSLFGLLNIQKAERILDMDIDDIWRKFFAILGEDIMDDGHLFVESENFTYDGHLRIVDYGSPQTHELLRKYGDRLLNEFRVP